MNKLLKESRALKGFQDQKVDQIYSPLKLQNEPALEVSRNNNLNKYLDPLTI